MADCLEALFKLLAEFSWRKLVAAGVAIVLILAGLLFFERYTSSFRLARLQKATELLTALHQLEGQGTNAPPELQRARKAITVQVLQAIEERPLTLEFIPSRLTFSTAFLWKFLAGSAFWLLLGLMCIPKIKTKDGRNELFGALFAAGVSGALGAMLPAICWPWFHLFLYPWLLIVGVILVLAPFLLLPGMRSAKRKAEKINCINNLKQVGLAAHIWATDHEDNLPHDLSAMNGKLLDTRATLCPSGNHPRFKVEAPGAPMMNAEGVYASCPIHNHVLLVNGSVRDLDKKD